jgi:cytoskeletal protein RodZ
MPIIVSCAGCTQRYVIHESQTGQRVGCPACRTPRAPKREPLPTDGLKTLVVGLFVGAAFLFALTATGVMWWVVVGPGSKRLAVGREQAPPTEVARAKAGTEPDSKRTVAEKTKIEPKQPDPQSPVAKKSDADGPDRKPPPPKELKPRTFIDAWAAAIKILDEQAAKEPEARAKAMKLLTGDQADVVAGILETLDDRAIESYSPTELARLKNLGFSLTVGVASAREAVRGGEFCGVAQRLWHPGMSDSQLAFMASYWYCLHVNQRTEVKFAVTKGTPTLELDPSTGQAFMILGCKKWLDDH